VFETAETVYVLPPVGELHLKTEMTNDYSNVGTVKFIFKESRELRRNYLSGFACDNIRVMHIAQRMNIHLTCTTLSAKQPFAFALSHAVLAVAARLATLGGFLGREAFCGRREERDGARVARSACATCLAHRFVRLPLEFAPLL